MFLSLLLAFSFPVKGTVHGYYPFNEGTLDEGKREEATESQSPLYRFYES